MPFGFDPLEMNWSIGIDIGGTAIKSVAAKQDGTILKRIAQPTNDGENSTNEWTQNARQIIADFEKEVGSSEASVGISSPGLAANDERCIAYLPGKLKGLQGLDWTDALKKDSLVPVLNDAHAALLGEAWIGAARDKQNVVLLTLGTGVGGAITSGGKLLKGTIGRAGHLGHMCMDIDGPPSICDMPGAVEGMIGNCTVQERSNGKYVSTQDLVDAYKANDPEATTIWLRSIRSLGCAIASYINIIDPEIVVLTGGISIVGNTLMDPLMTVLDEVEWRPGGHKVPVVFGSLGKWAGAIGAARLAMNHKASIQAPH
ncbi:MAG: ROK family protein [Verrucomicrobiales bacterium]|nr:ROK family protein [Verrucomicrobiaceae bacterium]